LAIGLGTRQRLGNAKDKSGLAAVAGIEDALQVILAFGKSVISDQ
jgi:hypothetical protein